MVSIRPAMGWLALVLFATTAQAEGPRGILRGKAPVQTVTAKTKAPPALVKTSTNTGSTGLSLTHNQKAPRTDYEAEIYAGIPLDDGIAKARGFDRGLVAMVFEKTRRATFRIGHDAIRRQLRFASVETTPGTLAQKAHVDVLDTDHGVIVIDTQTLPGGMFTTSDVYVFPEHASLDRRVGMIEASGAPAKERVRQAMVAAEWAPSQAPTPK